MRAWAELEIGARTALERQWAGVGTLGLPCGAAVTAASGEVVAAGRNHVYDPRCGPDLLQRTRVAHAEINALAAVDSGRDHSALTLWSTQHPCAMCAAAISFSGIGEVVYLADDPSDHRSGAEIAGTRAGVEYRPLGDGYWWAVSNLLFLAVAARQEGAAARNLRANAVRYPELVRLSLDCAASDALVGRARAGIDLATALAPLADRIARVGERDRRGAGA